MRQEEFWIDRLDQFGNVTGQFQPEVGGTITATSATTIVRSLTGLNLPVGETLATNDRLRPMVRITGSGNSYDDTDQPLAVILPNLGARAQNDFGEEREVNGHDPGSLLGGDFRDFYGVDSGTLLTEVASDLVVLAGLTTASYPDLPDLAGDYLAWPPGAPITDALTAINRLLGVIAPVDRSGGLTARTLPYIGVDVPVASWQAGDASEVFPGAVEVDDTYQIPNLWWVTSLRNEISLAGKFELPDDHEMSYTSTGTSHVKTMRVTGLTSSAACEQRARDEAQRDQSVHSTVDLACALNPTLEPWDVVTYKDRDWIVDSFTLGLEVGAGMKVRLRESLVAA